MESLTKENFWDEMSKKYPKAMKHFWKWIDQYKSEHDWNRLFNAGYDSGYTLVKYSRMTTTKAPKYYELPIAMQFGIFLEYVYSYYNEYKLFNPDKPGVELHYNDYVVMTEQTIIEVLEWLEERL